MKTIKYQQNSILSLQAKCIVHTDSGGIAKDYIVGIYALVCVTSFATTAGCRPMVSVKDFLQPVQVHVQHHTQCSSCRHIACMPPVCSALIPTDWMNAANLRRSLCDVIAAERSCSRLQTALQRAGALAGRARRTQFNRRMRYWLTAAWSAVTDQLRSAPLCSALVPRQTLHSLFLSVFLSRPDDQPRRRAPEAGAWRHRDVTLRNSDASMSCVRVCVCGNIRMRLRRGIQPSTLWCSSSSSLNGSIIRNKTSAQAACGAHKNVSLACRCATVLCLIQGWMRATYQTSSNRLNTLMHH